MERSREHLKEGGGMVDRIKLRIVNKFSNRNFKENKFRNAIMVVTLVIMVAMILVMNLMITSISENMRTTFQKQSGTKAHAIFNGLSQDAAIRIKNNPDVDNVGYSTLLGNVSGSNAVSLIELRAMDENFAKHNWTDIAQGRAPEKDSEIALATSTLDSLGLKHNIDEIVKIRWIDAGNNQVQESELLLVGYWNDNIKVESDFAWVSDSLLNDKDMEVSVMYKNSNKTHEKTVGISTSLNLSQQQYKVNTAYDNETLKNINNELLPYKIAILLICFSGILILFNILQISIKLDIKLYGRMKTLGSTPGQIKAVIYAQILKAVALSIPIGLIIGCFMSQYIATIDFLEPLVDQKISIEISSIVITMLLTLFVALISGFLPARTAGKVSPTELLNEDNSFGFMKKDRRHSPGLPMLFQLSLTNLGRNKLRSFISIGFMAMGLVMLSCVYVIDKSFDINKYMKEFSISDYSIAPNILSDGNSTYNSLKSHVPDDIIEKLDSIEGITEKGRLYSKESKINLTEQAIQNITNYYEANNGEILKYMSFDVEWNKGYQRLIQSRECAAIVFGIDGIATDSLVQDERLLKGNFDSDKFFSGKYAIAQGIYDSTNKNNQPTYQVGEKITIDNEEFEIIAIVEAPAPITEGKESTDAAFSLSFFIPANIFQQNNPTIGPRKYFFNANKIGNIEVEEYLEQNIEKDLEIVSEKTLAAKYKKETKAMMVVQMMVSIIIFSIGLLNLCNSMFTSTNIRRKEFAIMQSLGMTKKQLRSLLMFEGINYAGITLIVAYFFSLLLINSVVREYLNQQWSSTFQFTITPLLICTPIIIGIVIIIPLICFYRITTVSVINRMKN